MVVVQKQSSMAFKMKGFGGFKDSSKKENKVSFKPSISKPKGDGIVPIGKGGVMNNIRSLQKDEKMAKTGMQKAKVREEIASVRKEYNHPIYNQENTVSPVKKNKKLIDIADKKGQKGTDMLKKAFGNIPVSRLYSKFQKARNKFKKITAKKSITSPKIANITPMTELGQMKKRKTKK